MKEDKKFLLDSIFSKIQSGINPAKISKELKMSKQNLNYYLRQLKENGLIEKVGYGTWKAIKEVKKPDKVTSKKQIRGHAFNWKVKFQTNIDWKRKLNNNKVKYQLIGIKGTTPRIIFNNKKIWFTKSGLIIYEPQSFFSQSSFTSKGMAVWELNKTIKMLGRHLKIDLNHYQFTTSREHYGMIKNELAKQYDDEGNKLYIRDDRGLWMWIDFSHGVNELETNEPMNSRGVQNWFNDHKKHKFQVTPSFLLENINKVTENQLMFNENFESHVEAIKILSKTVKQLQKEIRRFGKAQ